MTINKRIQNLDLKWLLLIPIIILIFSVFSNYPIDLNMFYLSVDEKYEKLDPYKFSIYNFIKENVEVNSTVLFFDRAHYLLARSYLYPEINCTFIKYKGQETDKAVIKRMRVFYIKYIIIISGPHHLAENFDIFDKIEYSVQIYLLKLKLA